MQTLAETLDITLDIFKKTYTRQVGGRYALLEKKDGSYDCILLRGKKCTVYE